MHVPIFKTIILTLSKQVFFAGLWWAVFWAWELGTRSSFHWIKFQYKTPPRVVLCCDFPSVCIWATKRLQTNFHRGALFSGGCMGALRDPGGAWKTVWWSCCAGMIIDMVKSGALVSVKVHHAQLSAKNLSALAFTGRVDFPGYW